MEAALINVTLTGFYHKNQHCIGICFANHGSLNGPLRKAGALWSATHKCWWVPLSKEGYGAIVAACGDRAILNRHQLDSYLRKIAIASPEKKQASALVPEVAQDKQVNHFLPKNGQTMQDGKATKVANTNKIPDKFGGGLGIAPINAHVLPAMQQLLVLKGYSPGTQRTYLGEMSVYLQTLGGHAADNINVQRLKDYLQYCHTQLKLSENTIHSRMNGLKFYYEQVLGKEKFFWEIPRPKKHVVLPNVLSAEKIFEGLLAIDNLKHKVLLLMAYNAGLRVSEAVRIRITDINLDRMQLRVEKSKGKIDRMVPLSNAILPLLASYLKEYTPEKWLFEGQYKGESYSSRSAQIVFKEAYKQLGLPPKLSFHSLRHSYATHLHDNGTDIRFIQELLGHRDIKTTLRYTHVSQASLKNIENPLDAIMRRQTIEKR